MQLNLIPQVDLCYTLQRLAQNLRFELQLALVGNVLIVTAPAALEVWAARLDSVSGRFNHSHDRCTRKPRLLLPKVGLNLFARQYKRHKHSHAAAIGTRRSAREAIAAVD